MTRSSFLFFAGACTIGAMVLFPLISSCGVTIKQDETPTQLPSYTYEPSTQTPKAGPDWSIKVDPTLLNFGPVMVGTSSTQTVGFLNTGEESYHLVKIALYSPSMFFAVSDLTSDELHPGETLLVDMTFMPGQTGSYTATMELVTIEGGVPIVSMTGRGIAEPPPTPTPSDESPTPGVSPTPSL